MVAIKALIILSVILLATFVIVIEGEETFFARNITQAEEKCLNEFATYLWFGRCLDIYSQNDSSVCNAEIQELIWKKAEILWNDEVESKCAADIQSFPQCHCLQEFLQTKTGKQSTENTIVQCSNYRAFENCTNEVRRKCVAKVLDFRRVPWGCEEAFALYKCYDEQFQNATHCNNDIKKPFWEHEKYQVKRIFETECECVVELFDEKIKNAIPSQKSEPNSAYGFGIQSPPIGTMVIFGAFLSTMKDFGLMQYLLPMRF
ncbi:hypothetical protein DdX_18922 [Ditylenchus destructor]|uniref:Uncharacterized protein n=1 Tax=Ditylenchus destructor TaxID=166010 RepID=A0AAD4MK30_9BILA|nr:hypothetical protein DdX_18922 [Ditylenchus destructor]